VAKTAVMAVEISNESAASLIQSVTAHNFQSVRLPRPSMNFLNVSHGRLLVTHQPLHAASCGGVWPVYPQCCPMSGCCPAVLGGRPVVPSLALAVVSLQLADH
jgi:hypothetical protein